MEDEFSFPCLKCGHECADVEPDNSAITCPNCGFVDHI